ncbi:glycogen debranching protein [Streptomyces bathyalis]|uniref:Glycogen debranching protein n=1 Tax=Streptomyces bathyalis TaxID=2710756 RepID=A0A7T1TCM1_9ACTN|nr:glycogen debranching N-terminal domain-containing protein [Streptomyces bathyalis]QPP10483.1 glycogen debranching protein [Streptomyces bathyalis]
MSQPASPQSHTPGPHAPGAAPPARAAGPGGNPARGRIPPAPPPGSAEHQSAHAALVCVAAPHLVVSAEHGQLNGEGMEGFYYAGRRVISRCRVLLGGKEPLPLQGRMIGARQARFTATAPTVVGTGPDPEIVVDRLRSANGTERVTVRNTGGRPVRLPFEMHLGTDLAEIAAIAVGRAGDELPASVHGSGLSWSAGTLRATVTVEPQPDTSWARLGLLRWDWELAPGSERTVLLRTDLARLASGPDDPQKGGVRRKSGGKGKARKGAPRPTSVVAPRRSRPPKLWRGAHASADDRRVAAFFRAGLDDANALLLSDPAAPSDLHLAAGAPWRCALAPAESLRAARLLLPLGTRLAAGTLRTLARSQLTESGPDQGRLPGSLRHAGPYAPPSCSGAEATLLFPAVLAEARLWGLPECDIEQLLPAAERCLTWMIGAAGEGVLVPDPAPDGPYRCEVQASAHRAALLGAELLDACGGDRGAELRDWAAELGRRFREEFWREEDSGTELVMVRTQDGAALTHPSAAAAELLDTGLAGGGCHASGLLTPEQTAQLCRNLRSPALDSEWGLRSLGRGDPRHNPFGHRGGAVRVQESVAAVAGFAAAGHGREAGCLLRGVLDAATSFGLRLPEMYAAEQRSDGGVPLPHPAACRPAAVAAAGAVHLIITLAGVRPDVPAGTVSVRPLVGAPLGAVRIAGLRIAGQPFSVRVSGSGEAEVEEVADDLRIAVG